MLESYLSFVSDVDPMDQDFDALAWWKKYKASFPTLAKVAMQLLAVLASTVAVEQTFSMGAPPWTHNGRA